jgi:hypothetical protein
MNKSFLERAFDHLGTDSGVKGSVSALWRIVPQPIPSEGLARLRPKKLLTASPLTPMILSRFPFPNPLPPPFPARQCAMQMSFGEYSAALEVIFSLFEENLGYGTRSQKSANGVESSAAITRRMIKKVKDEASVELTGNRYGHGASSLDLAFERALQEKALTSLSDVALYKQAASRLLLCTLKLEPVSSEDSNGNGHVETEIGLEEKDCTTSIGSNESIDLEPLSVLTYITVPLLPTVLESEDEQVIESEVLLPLSVVKNDFSEHIKNTDDKGNASISSSEDIIIDKTASSATSSQNTSHSYDADDDEVTTPEKDERRTLGLNDDIDLLSEPVVWVKKALFSVAKDEVPSKPIPTVYRMNIWGAKDDVDDVLTMAGWKLARHSHHRVYKREILLPDGSKREQTFVRPVASGHDRMKDRSMFKDLKKREDEALDLFNDILDQMKKKKKSANGHVKMGKKA